MVVLVGVAGLLAGACGGGEPPQSVGSVVEVPGVFVEVTAGARHACGLRVDDTIACWGHNTEIWDIDQVRTNREGQLDAPSGRFTAISAGGYFTCGLRVDATIACWGNNFSGQLDAPAGRYTAVSAGSGHACALREGGFVDCWPPDTSGTTYIAPWRFAAIDAGDAHTCGLRADGIIKCWGVQGYESVARGPQGRWDRLAVGGTVACGVRADGTVACSHWNWTQQEPYDSVAVGWDHACGVRRLDDSVACWAWDWGGDPHYPAEHNTHGQASPPQGRFAAVAAGDELSCGLRGDGTVTCWGNVGGPAWNPPPLAEPPGDD